MKNKKYQLHRFAFYDRAAIEMHLESMAAQGWMIEKAASLVWRYRRIPPQKLHITVTYFPNASEFDPSSEGQQLLAQYCARDGWVLAAQWGQMQIFYNTAETPVPIETDAVVQVETIRRAMRRGMLPGQLYMLALCVYQMIFMGWQFASDPVDFLSTPAQLYMLPAWLLIFLAVLFELCAYVWWRKKMVTAAESGVQLTVQVRRWPVGILLMTAAFMIALAANMHAVNAAVLLWLGGYALTVFSTHHATSWMKKKGVPRHINKALSVVLCVVLCVAVLGMMTSGIIRNGLERRTPVNTYEKNGLSRAVYQDELPLQIEDLLELDHTDWSRERRRKETVLLSSTEYVQWPLTQDISIPQLAYTVIAVKTPILYETCQKGMLDQRRSDVIDGAVVLRDEYVMVDAAPWGARQAYRLYWSSGYLDRYLLCYENQIVELHLDWTPTAAQMAIVAEKLGGQ